MLTFNEFKLNEIGDSSVAPLPWKLITIDPDQTIYHVNSPKSGLDYSIFFSEYGYNSLRYVLAFAANSNNYDKDYSPFEVTTNAGDMFGLMSALVEICKDFVKRLKPKIIIFSGTPDKAGNKISNSSETKRNKLYLQFLEKNISKIDPDATWKIEGSKITIGFP